MIPVICTPQTKAGCGYGVNSIFDSLGDWFCMKNLWRHVTENKGNSLGSQHQQNINFFSYRNTVIEPVETLSFLVLQIEKQLNQKVHRVTYLEECWLLLCVQNNCIGVDATLSSYHDFIQSRIRYGIIFWGNSVDTNRFFLLQKRCLRTIFKLNQMETCKNVFTDNSILTLYSLYTGCSISDVPPRIFLSHS